MESHFDAKQYKKRIKLSFTVRPDTHEPLAKMIAESHHYWFRGVTPHISQRYQKKRNHSLIIEKRTITSFYKKETLNN
jgi:hypothetical protein